jgi:integrase
MNRGVEAAFPNRGLKYPKSAEKPPFQTRQEIERQLVKGNLSQVEQEELWDCLYLTISEIEEVIGLVREEALGTFVYPMCVMAAHTGARRSEMVRAQANDFDFEAGTVMIREKKRSRTKRTTRSVPLSPLLRRVMTEWLAGCPSSKYAFCREIFEGNGNGGRWAPITVSQATGQLRRALDGTKWEKLRGWHIFRHSFISNCASKGIDQRMIDIWSGHQTEEMRRRYTHLFPDAQHEAIRSVFGGESDQSSGRRPSL